MKYIFKINSKKTNKVKSKTVLNSQEEGTEQDENIKETTPLPAVKLNKKLLRILSIIVASLILVLFCSGFFHTSGEFTENIQGSTLGKSNFQLIGKKIATVSDTSFTINKKNGKQISNTLHSFNQPAMDTDGNYAIIYNLNGKGYQVEKNSSHIISSSMDNDIISAAISKSGVYALLTKSNDYAAQLTVYSSNCSEKYKYYFAENYVTDIAINKEGTKAVVSSLQSENGAMKSVIYVLDFNKEEALVKLDSNENMVFCVDFLNDGTPVAVGDKYLSLVDISKSNKNDFNYEGKTLVSYSVNPALGVSLALSSSDDIHNCDCVIIDSNGNKKANFSTDISVQSISVKGNKIAILSDGTAYIYKLDGSNVKKVDVGADASKILLYSRNGFYILGESEIRGKSF